MRKKKTTTTTTHRDVPVVAVAERVDELVDDLGGLVLAPELVPRVHVAPRVQVHHHVVVVRGVEHLLHPACACARARVHVRESAVGVRTRFTMMTESDSPLLYVYTPAQVGTRMYGRHCHRCLGRQLQIRSGEISAAT